MVIPCRVAAVSVSSSAARSCARVGAGIRPSTRPSASISHSSPESRPSGPRGKRRSSGLTLVSSTPAASRAAVFATARCVDVCTTTIGRVADTASNSSRVGWRPSASSVSS
nr:hypothetical protein [Pseudonocardia nigra]